MSEELELTQEEQALIEADRTGAEVPEQATEAEPETAPETPEVVAEQEREPAKPPEGYVPHGALHEERARRKQLQQELQEYREKLARVDERLKFLTEGPKQPEPDPNDDPLGYSQHEIQRVKQSLDEVSKQYPNQINELRSELESLRMQRTVERMEADFERNAPDYRQALEHYAKTRAEAVIELGYEPEEAARLVGDEMVSTIQRAIAVGKNPAEVVYKMATRSGYAKKSEEKNIDTLKKAETASKSLSETSGKVKGELTAEALAAMSDEEFAKLSDEQFRKAMGG